MDPLRTPPAGQAADAAGTPARRRLLASALAAPLMSGCAGVEPPRPTVDVGRVERLPPIASRFVAPRQVDVWLPPGFAPEGRHAVLYMHDGQMLYDARTTWNRQAWNVPPTAARLIAERRVRPFMVVGVWNGGPALRFREYFPQGFLRHLPEGPARQALLARGLGDGPLADAYLRFLVEELKPLVDARYRPATGRADTFLAGSSMGGLISLYALTERPDTFGGAACVSTHWIGGSERNVELPAAALGYLRERLPPPGRHRLWMDRGTVGLDALYDEAQAQVDALLRSRGWGSPDWVSRVYAGAAHDETSWAARLHDPLQHLLGA